MQYNINVAVSNDTLSNVLMPIFGDAPTKGLAPSNILINNGSMSYSDLVSSTTKNKDIIFNIKNNLENNDEIEKPFETKTNVFNFVMEIAAQDYTEQTFIDKEKVEMYMSSEYRDFSIKKPAIYNQVDLNSNMFFNVPRYREGVKYHNIFNSDVTPILLEEHEGKGFVRRNSYVFSRGRSGYP